MEHKPHLKQAGHNLHLGKEDQTPAWLRAARISWNSSHATFMENGDIQQDKLSPPPTREDHRTKCEANLIRLPATHPDCLQLLYQNAAQAHQ
jgi:hypothetical protein